MKTTTKDSALKIASFLVAIFFVTLLLTILPACPPTGGSSTPTPTPGPTASPTPQGVSLLKLYDKNPRYFQDTVTGKPVLIAAHGNLVPTSRTADQAKDLKFLTDNKMIYDRVWHLIPWDHDNPMWPWPKTGAKWDLSKWSDEYWQAMNTVIGNATKAGIHSEVMLFDRVGISPPSPDRWGSNPWAKDNNVNDIETRTKDKEGVPEFYDLGDRPKMFKFQQEYVRKMLIEMSKYSVLYEIENEHWRTDSKPWADFWGKFVKDQLKEVSPNRMPLVSYGAIGNDFDLDQVYESPYIDIVNKHFGGEAESSPQDLNQYLESRWHFGKAINIDEFANGLDNYDLMRKMGWIIVMSGGHFHVEDADPKARAQDVARNVNNFVDFTKWEFYNSTPRYNWIKGGYCMIAKDYEYACYLEKGGDYSANLSAGKWQVELYDTQMGGVVNNGIFSRVVFDHAGGAYNFKTPDARDWVVRFKSLTNLTPPPLEAPLGCVPKPPPLDTINVKIHSQSGERYVLDSTPMVYDFDYCTSVGFINRKSCPLRQEGDPLRLTCEQEVLGAPAPVWSSPTGNEIYHLENPFLAVMLGKGKALACSTSKPIVCGSVKIE